MKHISNPTAKTVAAIVLAVTLLFGAFTAHSDSTDHLTVYAGTMISANPEFGSVAFVEFPFSISRHEFSFFVPDSADGGLYARVFAQVDLFDSGGYAVDSAASYFSLKAGSQEEARQEDFRVFNRLGLMAPAGKFSARLTVIDVVSKAQGECFLDNIVVELTGKDRLNIGGACVAYNVRYVGEDNPSYNPRLLKNGFHIVPNPVSIFSESDTVMYIYGEIYNLHYSDSAATQFELAVAVLDNWDNVYQGFGARIAPKPGPSAVISESIEIGGFEPGAYSVRIIVTDFDSGQTDTTLIPFGVVSSSAVLSAAAAAKQREELFGSLTLQDHLNMVKYLLVPEQLQILNSLSDSGKVNFLNQYWKEHDTDPATAEVENRLRMIERYKFSNKIFSTNPDRTNGWSTDRGRILMTYGHPDERDDNQAPRIGNPYEVWHFRSIGEGKIFIFEDWSGSDDYRLVHSNVFGEVYNRDWQERIDQGFIDLPD